MRFACLHHSCHFTDENGVLQVCQSHHDHFQHVNFCEYYSVWLQWMWHPETPLCIICEDATKTITWRDQPLLFKETHIYTVIDTGGFHNYLRLWSWVMLSAHIPRQRSIILNRAAQYWKKKKNTHRDIWNFCGYCDIYKTKKEMKFNRNYSNRTYYLPTEYQISWWRCCKLC